MCLCDMRYVCRWPSGLGCQETKTSSCARLLSLTSSPSLSHLYVAVTVVSLSLCSSACCCCFSRFLSTLMTHIFFLCQFIFYEFHIEITYTCIQEMLCRSSSIDSTNIPQALHGYSRARSDHYALFSNVSGLRSKVRLRCCYYM